VRATSPRQVNLRLLLDLVGDRERDLVVLDAGVENLVVGEGGSLQSSATAGRAAAFHLAQLGTIEAAEAGRPQA
jgi:hypothetical protein